MKRYTTYWFLAVIFSMSMNALHAMQENSTIKEQRIEKQKLWQILDNPSEPMEDAIASVKLTHPQFVHAVLCKLAGDDYPTLSDNKKPLLNTDNLRHLHTYCCTTSDEKRVLIQQSLNNIPNAHDRSQFRRDCATYFRLASHAHAEALLRYAYENPDTNMRGDIPTIKLNNRDFLTIVAHTLADLEYLALPSDDLALIRKEAVAYWKQESISPNEMQSAMMMHVHNFCRKSNSYENNPLRTEHRTARFIRKLTDADSDMVRHACFLYMHWIGDNAALARSTNADE